MTTSMSILALGAESAGNFSVFSKDKIYHSQDFGDLLEEKNFQKFKKTVLQYLKQNKIRPNVVLSDLHPLFKTTLWANELAQKFKAKHVKIQHHIAHIFSAIGENLAKDYAKIQRLQKNRIIFGIACDGTGYGLDGKIWGGETFQLDVAGYGLRVRRIGHLENQIMIGGDLAVKEPARMLISILNKFLNKKGIYGHVKKYYTKNQFELLYNQHRQNFNCQQTSSAGRILDAVSLFLGFCQNQRNYKHEPIDLLEKNSTLPYKDIKPKLKKVTDDALRITRYELLTTPLFEYLIKNLSKDKKRLAATSQIYIAQGLYKIISNLKSLPRRQAGQISKVYFAGGIANNKIISEYLKSRGTFLSQKIPRGDAGISFGQIICYLLTDARN
jgi:hydrogenase maturation protein HypF